MWNFGIPYKLKQWIDVITQPGLTFRFDPAQGYLPLLKDRPTIVILASGSDFVTGMNRGRIDMATPYLREVLRFIGISDVRFVPIGPTAGPAERPVPRGKMHTAASPTSLRGSDRARDRVSNLADMDNLANGRLARAHSIAGSASSSRCYSDHFGRCGWEANSASMK